MALMVGTGPFGTQTAGTFNFEYEAPKHQLYWEPSPRRISVVVAGETIARSDRATLLHETGLMPVYYLPEEDVRMDLLESTETHTTCPFKGQASYYTIRVGDDERVDAVWTYPDPKDGCPPIAGYVAFRWDAVDEWWEEAERITVHPRDPFHRVDVMASDRHVVVEVDGTVVAESHAPAMLFETGLPPRFYLLETEFDRAALRPADTVTECPYKGVTSRYYDLVVGDTTVENAIWVYDHPRPEAYAIRGRLGIYGEKVDLIVDGERWQRPALRPNWP